MSLDRAGTCLLLLLPPQAGGKENIPQCSGVHNLLAQILLEGWWNWGHVKKCLLVFPCWLKRRQESWRVSLGSSWWRLRKACPDREQFYRNLQEPGHAELGQKRGMNLVSWFLKSLWEGRLDYSAKFKKMLLETKGQEGLYELLSPGTVLGASQTRGNLTLTTILWWICYYYPRSVDKEPKEQATPYSKKATKPGSQPKHTGSKALWRCLA